MRVLKLTLAYDGTDYSGWQVQPAQPTIQASLEKALADVTGEAIRVLGSGRTDSGVHALGQVVGFSTHSKLELDVLQRALNARLPDDIVVVDIVVAADGFHAIADAVSKRYRYVIDDGPLRDVFSTRFCWRYPVRLDAQAMAQAADSLIGKHDFASFQSTGAPRESTVRTISELTVRRKPSSGQGGIVIEIVADGFLYNMVRAIVGTLVDVGRRAKPPQWLAEVLAARDRDVAGQTAPPQGLFLVEVDYGD